jgi:pimeloyl-ACP methyl ester carboxylesterase
MTPQQDDLEVSGTRIAIRYRPGLAPGAMWLGGYRSDMKGTKAEALDAWAERSGRACLRHDYSGHGESGGRFEDGTISRWLDESLAVLRRFAPQRTILVGSSMGAWIALRMIQELRRSGDGGRIAGLLLVAPAPDFTIDLMEPQLSAAQLREIEEKGFLREPSDYSDEPNIYTRALFEDGRRNRVLDGIIETGCPVHIIQGMNDPDVPYLHAEKLVRHLPVCDVTLSLVRDGDHRLSRPQDIDLILRSLEGLVSLAG